MLGKQQKFTVITYDVIVKYTLFLLTLLNHKCHKFTFYFSDLVFKSSCNIMTSLFMGRNYFFCCDSVCTKIIFSDLCFYGCPYPLITFSIINTVSTKNVLFFLINRVALLLKEILSM